MRYNFIIVIAFFFISCNGKIKVVTYYETSDRVESISYVQHGKKNGTAKVYYENGQLKEQGNWKDDKQTGLWHFYYDDGVKKAEIEFVNDLQDGLTKIYYPDGNINEETYFSNNKVNGTSILYTDEGTIYQKSTWDNGQLLQQSNPDSTLKLNIVKP